MNLFLYATHYCKPLITVVYKDGGKERRNKLFFWLINHEQLGLINQVICLKNRLPIYANGVLYKHVYHY